MKRGARLAACALAIMACGRAPAELEILEEILASRNDNDPRLDRDFDDLSPETKLLFREKYRSTPREKRNERGTIVYLLGRNLRSPEDWEFLREVIGEPPCLSLADCSRKSAEPGAPGDEVTLAYPALVALRQARRALEAGSGAQAREVFAAAKASKIPAVARMAERLSNEQSK